MSAIQDLLTADAENVKNCERLFNDFSPDLSQSLYDCATFYDIFFRVLSNTFQDDDDQSIIDQSERNNNVSERELAKSRFWSRRARATLLLLSYRSYLWAATDIYRTRTTSSLNNMRQQIESAFYTNLIQGEHSIGEEWFNVGSGDEGKRFFRKYSEQFRAFCDEYRLADTYNRISGAASHSRLSSVIYSLETKLTVADSRYSDLYSIKMQEVNKDKPEQFILAILWFLSNQIRLFRAFLKAFPEMGDPLFRETRLPMLEKTVAHLFDVFRTKYPEMVNELIDE